MKKGAKTSSSIASDFSVSNWVGGVLGGAGIVYTLASDAARPQGITAGTWVKGGIQTLEIAFPEVGVFYGGVDILTGLISGETLTDRIGDGIDNIH